MTIWKVWALNCVRPKGMAIVEIDEDDVKKEIRECVDYWLEQPHNLWKCFPEDCSPESDRVLDIVWELYTEQWRKTRILSCGDYYITESDERPERPNMCSLPYVWTDKEVIERFGFPKQIVLNAILLELHELGGCDADDEWSKAWDEAISSAIEVVEKYSSYSVEQLLEEE